MTINNGNVDTRVDTVTINANSNVILGSGTYWVNDLVLGINAKISVASASKAIIFVNNLSLSTNLRFNSTGSEDQLTIVAMNNMSVGSNTQMRGYLYVNGDLSWGDNIEFYGAINASNATIGDNSNFYTRVSGLSSAEFGGICGDSSNLPAPIIYYSMDMCSVSSGTNTIVDEIGSQDADTEGGVSINNAGDHCQALKLDGNQSYIDMPDPGFSGLSAGSISLYIYTPDLSHSSVPSQGSMTLFSRDANGFQTGGHLTAWVTDSGAIEVRQQSSSASYNLITTSNVIQENTWHHIVYTWGSDGMRIYVDGQSLANSTTYTGGLAANGVKMAIGASTIRYDPASSSSRTSQLEDFFIGSIDEVRIFDTQLSMQQVASLNELASGACSNCIVAPVLVSHWGGDVCSIDANQLADIGSGHDAVIRNGISVESSSRFCQGLSFDGDQSYATVTHHSDFEIADGAISMWFKVTDLSHSNNNYAGGNALFAKDSINYSNGGHLEIRVDSAGKIQVRHQTINSSLAFGTSAVVVQENQWHHLVYSFGSQGVSIYVDNQQVYFDNYYTNGLGTNDEVMVFGATARRASKGQTSASNFNDFLKGELDQIKIYRNQPSSSDVESWFNESQGVCATCDSLQAKYTFENAQTGTIPVADNSGNGNTASLGTSLSIDKIANNISCQAMSTPQSGSTDATYYFDSGITPNELGTRGSISFWYQSKTAWNNGVARQLFDATNATSGIAKYFFLAIQSDSRLRFGLEDANDLDVIVSTSTNSYAADTWVHISVQYNLIDNEYSIYLDGIDQTNSVSRDVQVPEFGPLNTLVFGDNRSTYNVSGATTNPSYGYFDDIRIYAQSISSSQIAADIADVQACPVIDHYRIEHPATALTCDTPEITLKACVNSDCSELSTQSSSVSLSPNEFSTSNTVTFTGQTSLSLNPQSPGTLTLGTTSQTPSATMECSNGCEIEYEDVGVQFFNRASGALNFSATPFVAQSSLADVGIRIAGISSGGLCGGAVDGQSNINLTYSCVQSGSIDYTPSVCNVPFAGIALSGGNAQSGSLSLSFDSNGESDFGDFSFADASLLRLTASATVDGVAVQSASTDISIVPANLVIASNANAVNTAGETMTLSVTAKGALGAVLPGYQANDLELSVKRLIPSSSDGVDSQFYIQSGTASTTSLSEVYSNITMNFSNGVASSNSAYMEEVGTYVLNMRDSNYLGAQISASEYSLGRFIPAYFDLVETYQPVLQNTVGDTLTYIGQAFEFAVGLEPSVTVTAYNALGQITRNYASDLWTLDVAANSSVSSPQVTDNSGYSGSLSQSAIASSISTSSTAQYDGVGVFTVNGLGYTYQKVAAPTGIDVSPFPALFDLGLPSAWFVDADGICYKPTYPGSCASFSFEDITGADMRYGRLNVQNAFGPETQALQIPITLEYLDGGQWRVNTADDYTLMTLNQSAGDISIIHDVQSPTDLTGLIPSISISSIFDDGILPAEDTDVGPFLSGGEAQSGSFYIEVIPRNVSGHWSNYLNVDWDGDGDIDNDDNPSGNIILGIYNSNDRTLHWREELN